jgi:hypothetical protein
MLNWMQRIASTLAACASLGAHANLYTDWWWSPQAPGWDAGIFHQGDVAAVTLRVIGDDGTPVWYRAVTRRFGYDAAGAPALAGELYRVDGPVASAAPEAASAGPVGTLSLEPRPGGALRLSYATERTQGQQDLVRVTIAVADVGGAYAASFVLRQAAPGHPPSGTRRYAADLLVEQDGDTLLLRVTEPEGECAYRGTYVPQGKLGRVTGTFGCGGTGAQGAFEISELELAAHGISGYLRTWTPGANEYGRFAAARF